MDHRAEPGAQGRAHRVIEARKVAYDGYPFDEGLLLVVGEVHPARQGDHTGRRDVRSKGYLVDAVLLGKGEVEGHVAVPGEGQAGGRTGRRGRQVHLAGHIGDVGIQEQLPAHRCGGVRRVGEDSGFDDLLRPAVAGAGEAARDVAQPPTHLGHGEAAVGGLQPWQGVGNAVLVQHSDAGVAQGVPPGDDDGLVVRREGDGVFAGLSPVEDPLGVEGPVAVVGLGGDLHLQGRCRTKGQLGLVAPHPPRLDEEPLGVGAARRSSGKGRRRRDGGQEDHHGQEEAQALEGESLQPEPPQSAPSFLLLRFGLGRRCYRRVEQRGDLSLVPFGRKGEAEQVQDHCGQPPPSGAHGHHSQPQKADGDGGAQTEGAVGEEGGLLP